MPTFISEDMISDVFSVVSPDRIGQPDLLTNLWGMMISMNGCASTKKISMMKLFLMSNFCARLTWFCRAWFWVSFWANMSLHNDLNITSNFYPDDLLHKSCNPNGNSYLACKYEELQRIHGYDNSINCENYPNKWRIRNVMNSIF